MSAWESAPLVEATPGWASAPLVKPSPKAMGYLENVGANIKAAAGEAADVGAGLLRGAGSIGSTLLIPGDAIASVASGNGFKGVMDGDAERRQGMTDALGTMGADTSSVGFHGGKLMGEIAGTAGAGSLIAAPLRAGPLATAIGSNGMKTGAALAPGLTARAVDMGTRMVGSGTSATAAGTMIDPRDALTAGAIGTLFPPVARLAGAAGAGVGRLMRGAEQTPEAAAAINTARASGLVIPPDQANPSLLNKLMVGFSGKASTAQNASAQNAPLINAKAARDLGLPSDTKITMDVIGDVRKKAVQAYEAVKDSGTVTPGVAYGQALDKIEAPFVQAAQGFPDAAPSPVLALVKSLRSDAFDAGSAVAKIKVLRTAADDGFRTGNTDVARASKAAANALEDALESHLAARNPDALGKFRDARTLYAKSITAEKALNKETGNIDASRYASELKRNKPLSGEGAEIGQFATRFPKAVQRPEQMGSLPQTSPLDFGAAGISSLMAGNMLPMVGLAARPMIRAAALSGPVQNRLIQQVRGPGMDPRINQLLYRAVPQTLNDR